MTKPFEQHLLFELINSTVADVSRKENVDYHAVDNLIDRYVELTIDFSKTKYQERITNYFIGRNNSGFVEGFNNKVKVLNADVMGY